jgi:Helix-turn-helix.
MKGLEEKMSKKVNLKLRDLLEEHNMTQKELAVKAGVRENTISDLLKDNKQGIRFETLARIASAFNLSNPNDIFEFTDEEK